MEDKVKDDILFQNNQENKMSFESVFNHIVQFMQARPSSNFRLMVGTDSQVHQAHTVFITGIVIQNKGNGVWACMRKVIIPRKMLYLKEKIRDELALSEEIISLFTEERKRQLHRIVLPYVCQGASFTMEGHMDIGAKKRNKTQILVHEMVGKMKRTGVEPKIKPEALVASCYANRYTK